MISLLSIVNTFAGLSIDKHSQTRRTLIGFHHIFKSLCYHIQFGCDAIILVHWFDIAITTALLLYRLIFDWSLFGGIYFMLNFLRFDLLLFRINFYQWFWYRCSIHSIVIYWEKERIKRNGQN